MKPDVKEQVISILSIKSGVDKDVISINSSLVQDLKLDGDDAVDAIIEISKTFKVNVSEFDASQYFNPEPNILSVFSSKRVARKNVTVGQIIDGARRGKFEFG